MEIAEVNKKAVPVLRSFGVRRASLFGSVARGERDVRDVDMLVEMARPYGLFKFLALKMELEEALQKKVDLVEYSALKPRIRERALRDAVPLV